MGKKRPPSIAAVQDVADRFRESENIPQRETSKRWIEVEEHVGWMESEIEDLGNLQDQIYFAWSAR